MDPASVESATSASTALVAAIGALIGAFPALLVQLFKIRSENQIKRRADKMAEDSFTISQYKDMIRDLRKEVSDHKKELAASEKREDAMQRRILHLENEVRKLGGTVEPV